ncbi:MAG: glycosyltransferase [Agathobacter sp.]|nr:glycosyltransferase [Agathobacter sp.]
MENIMLSIYVATYNHENYIAKALDSILMQETEYSFEVLIGEDCSTDQTRKILQEYEAKYPNRFQMFYRDHNMYHDEIRNGEDLKRRCKGKYMIALEGDDFWTDAHKIQKQITFLENHPEYLAVAHKCVVVGEDSLPNGEVYSACEDFEYSIHHFGSEIMPGQLATVMYRNFYKDNLIDPTLCRSKLAPGDRCTYFTLLVNGKIHCMKEEMSAYRHITQSGSSYSATTRYNYASAERLYKAFIDYATLHKNDECRKMAEYMFTYNVLLGYKAHQISFKEAWGKVFCCKGFIRNIGMCVKSLVNRRLLKKKVFV